MRNGISMVALVITIIVIIVLTSAVVITSVRSLQQAQLATFYNNVATVQDLVTLTMSENMVEGALSGLDNNYKWTYIVENPAIAFIGMIEGIEENMAPIMVSLLNNTTIAEGEKTKYYVGKSGQVYYQGFEYEGKTYYNKDKIYIRKTNEVLWRQGKICSRRTKRLANILFRWNEYIYND